MKEVHPRIKIPKTKTVLLEAISPSELLKIEEMPY